jgi:sulfate adenylyltransferase
MKILKVDGNILQEAENIFNGAYAPLSGFLKEGDFKSVLKNIRLSNGAPWSIPIVLDINEDSKQGLEGYSRILLVDISDGREAVMENIEAYGYDKEEYAKSVYGTDDQRHPGVAKVMRKGKYLLGGDITSLKNPNRPLFPEHTYSPSELKQFFKDKGWNKVAAFQTRNVPHRSHEFLQKEALSKMDGLLIQPVLGKKKPGDFRDEVIIEAYKKILGRHYPEGKYVLAVLHYDMNYAGPREAIHHAIIRRNFGCTHMIIGRDHAGVGKYYDPYAAHKIFDMFSDGELGIEIFKFDDVLHCRECGGLNFCTSCGHDPENHFSISGTKMREMIQRGEMLPGELVREEISEYLLSHPDPFV